MHNKLVAHHAERLAGSLKVDSDEVKAWKTAQLSGGRWKDLPVPPELSVDHKPANVGNGKVDLIFQPGFRKGNEYLEEEIRLASLVVVPEVEDTRFVQSGTDWNVEAVVDEDQL
jgi:hypothetical protein